jgi:hypothetical protein
MFIDLCFFALLIEFFFRNSVWTGFYSRLYRCIEFY